MGKVAYHWTDPRHSAFDNSPLRLAAIAGADSFSYYITDRDGMPCEAKVFTASRKYHFFDKPLGYLGQLMGDDDLLYADFDKVMIAVRGIPFVAVDPDVADTNVMRTKLLAVTDVSGVDDIFCDRSDENLSLAFALPEAFARETRAWFSDAQISHIMTALMTYTIKHSQGSTEPVMLVNVTHGLAELILCRNSLLLFANHYKVSGPEDVLYYALAVLQNLHLSNDEVVVKCAGHGAANTIPVLQAFLPRVDPFSPPELHPLPDFPAVESTDLICLSQCA